MEEAEAAKQAAAAIAKDNIDASSAAENPALSDSGDVKPIATPQ
jgi:hypothetical protein